ncbi:AfsR/SARP family transcriptional regulator [Cellulomonas shaoxiangyii]|uniref:AfsR family transcriptional regulator n=1 Tax=Cellulomonas shaoxiangyii TaxID=2566013 RepID=A0A4P7SLB4_9CELL|nr:BTAD domain-containing putative transcriptional regulator [Cellulomonas shaoxiangyii]QCB94711.1 AfsR family transcriptional regulator [Cellulomonas shaoxiangyii]TGY85053.1 AfsR family transcriptional regulator [Cellulomonas shaoxiangyii]
MTAVEIRVLGPVSATADGVALPLHKRRLRELLGVLVAAGGRTVPTDALVDDLWDGAGPAGAVGAVRTFVGELRRALEPDRAPRTPPRVLVTVGTGYALRLPPGAVDAWRVVDAAAEARGASPAAAVPLLTGALAQWRGDAYEEFADRPWAQPARARLAALRADLVERLGDALLATGRASDAVALLDPHVAAHPWREDGWRLLATALHRAQRPADALDVLRRGRRTFADDLGLDPGPAFVALEQEVLERRPQPWQDGGLSALDRRGARARLEASGAVLTSLAVSGDLATVRTQRLATIAAAEQLDDPQLTARVIGGLEAPGVWTRSDDEELAAAIVAAATRTLPRVAGSPHARARLLATIALEDRGTAAREAEAHEAERLARDLGDRRLLCLALSGRFMQRFARAGLARDRAGIGAELVESARRAESTTFEICGRIVRMQALCALGRLDDAAAEADAVDALASAAERPLASTFTAWFRHTFAGAPEPAAPDEMPGFSRGIVALSRVTRALRTGGDVEAALGGPDGAAPGLGPYEAWVRPLLLARAGHRDEARYALATAPPPRHDLLLEVTWSLLLTAAREADVPDVVARAWAALLPARGERAAGSGVVDAGDVRTLLGG